MELSTLNGQLKITNGSNEEFYKFETMKSISPAVDAKGNWYVAINFIANDKNNSLRLYTETISNIDCINASEDKKSLFNQLYPSKTCVINVEVADLFNSLID